MRPNFPIVTSRQKALLATSIIFTILPSTAVTLRIYAQRLARRALTASDYCIVAAGLFAVGFQIATLTAILRGGMGFGHEERLIQDWGEEPVHQLQQIVFSLELLWTLSMSLCKTSILLLYIKLFADSYMVVASKITIVLMTLWPIATILGALLICTPVQENWESLTQHHCGNQIVFYFTSGMINLTTDFFVIGLPLPHLYRLRLPKPSKIGLIVVFCLGFITSIVSIIRLPYLLKIEWTDLTWTIAYSNIVTAIEPSMAVTLACVPMLKPLLSLGKRARRRQATSRVIVLGNELRTHCYDPDRAGMLKLRADRVCHTARVEAQGPMELCDLPHNYIDPDDSTWDLKEGESCGAEITVNRQWEVKSERIGDWTQMLGSQSS